MSRALLLYFRSYFPDILWLKRVYLCNNFGPCEKPANNYAGTEMEYIYRPPGFQPRRGGTPPSSARWRLEARALSWPDSGSNGCPVGDQCPTWVLPLCRGEADSIYQNGWTWTGVPCCGLIKGVARSPGQLQTGHR